jgi:hypothetical protein
VLAIACVCLALWIGVATRRYSLTVALAHTAGVLLGVSPLPIRDAFVTGHIGFSLLSNTNDWFRIWEAPFGTFLVALGRRISFALGYTRLISPGYRVRPHWMALWAATALLCLTWMRTRRLPMFDVMVAVYAVAYIAPVVLVGDIASYGGRMVAIIMPLLAYLAVRAGDTILQQSSLDANHARTTW